MLGGFGEQAGRRALPGARVRRAGTELALPGRARSTSICAGGATLVVCEVKARSGSAARTPLEAVTPAKQRRLRRLAAAYLRQQERRGADIRFDVAASSTGRSRSSKVRSEAARHRVRWPWRH